MTAAQANQLAQATRVKALPNMVCFSYRFKAAARYARELIASGKIGRVIHVDMQ